MLGTLSSRNLVMCMFFEGLRIYTLTHYMMSPAPRQHISPTDERSPQPREDHSPVMYLSGGHIKIKEVNFCYILFFHFKMLIHGDTHRWYVIISSNFVKTIQLSSYRWLQARLWYPQCLRTGNTAVLYLTIDVWCSDRRVAVSVHLHDFQDVTRAIERLPGFWYTKYANFSKLKNQYY